MVVNREALYADLDQLPEQEIEARLAADVYGEEKRPFVQLYLSDMLPILIEVHALVVLGVRRFFAFVRLL